MKNITNPNDLVSPAMVTLDGEIVTCKQGLTKLEYFTGLFMAAYIQKDGADENTVIYETARWAVKCAHAVCQRLNEPEEDLS